MNKFKLQDLVTVVENEPDLWYTYMDVIRKERQGRTGRVIKMESLTFTHDDLEWYFLGRDPKTTIDKFGDDWEQTEYSYRVGFPDCEEIIFTEKHLRLF